MTAHVIADLLESEFGAEVRLESRGTAEILNGIEHGEIQIHPEIWLPNLQDEVKRLAWDGNTLTLSQRAVPASQNLCVTPETARPTGIDEVADLADPEVYHLSREAIEYFEPQSLRIRPVPLVIAAVGCVCFFGQAWSTYRTRKADRPNFVRTFRSMSGVPCGTTNSTAAEICPRRHLAPNRCKTTVVA